MANFDGGKLAKESRPPMLCNINKYFNSDNDIDTDASNVVTINNDVDIENTDIDNANTDNNVDIDDVIVNDVNDVIIVKNNVDIDSVRIDNSDNIADINIDNGVTIINSDNNMNNHMRKNDDSLKIIRRVKGNGECFSYPGTANDKNCVFKIDTGSDVSILNFNLTDPVE